MCKRIMQLIVVLLVIFPAVCFGGGFIGGFITVPGSNSFSLRGNIKLPLDLLKESEAVGPTVKGLVLFEYSVHGTKVTIVIPEKEASKRGVHRVIVDSSTYALSRTDYETLIAESSQSLVGLPDANGKFTSQICEEKGLIGVIAGVDDYKSKVNLVIARVTIKFIKNDSVLTLYGSSGIKDI